MYCRNCGKLLPEKAEVCESCGVTCGNGMFFCLKCGKPVNPGEELCADCRKPAPTPVPEKKATVAAEPAATKPVGTQPTTHQAEPEKKSGFFASVKNIFGKKN